jgi:hypothetical protein
MEAEKLFLVRCRQIASLLESNNEVDLLDLSGLLRQLLLDQHALVDSVNGGSSEKVKLEFYVGAFSHAPDQFASLLFLEDGIDPQTRRPGAPSAVLSMGNFLNHAVIYASGEHLTIKDVIKHAAESAGGVHHNPHSKKHRVLAQLSRRAAVGGLPLGIRMLKAIARVTMRTLTPLIEKVENRA